MSTSVARFGLVLGAFALACSASAPPPRVSSVGGSAPPGLSDPSRDYTPSCGVELGTSHFPPAGEEDAWLHRERAGLALQLSAERKCKGTPGVITLVVRENLEGVAQVEGTLGGDLTECSMVNCIQASVESYQSPHKPSESRTLLVPIRAPGDGSLALDDTIPRPTHAIDACKIERTTDKLLGHVPGKAMQDIVRARFSAFQGCYRQGVKKNRELAGDIVVRFLIGKDGKVSHAGLDKLTLRDCDVGACIVEDIQALSFPPPSDGVVTVIYPLHFEPN